MEPRSAPQVKPDNKQSDRQEKWEAFRQATQAISKRFEEAYSSPRYSTPVLKNIGSDNQAKATLIEIDEHLGALLAAISEGDLEAQIAENVRINALMGSLALQVSSDSPSAVPNHDLADKGATSNAAFRAETRKHNATASSSAVMKRLLAVHKRARKRAKKAKRGYILPPGVIMEDVEYVLEELEGKAGTGADNEQGSSEGSDSDGDSLEEYEDEDEVGFADEDEDEEEDEEEEM